EEPAGAAVERCPASDVVLTEPAVIAGLAERHRNEQRPVRTENSTQLPKSLTPTIVVTPGIGSVHRVVGADVLEGRDEKHLIERAITERQRAHVCLDRLHPLDISVCQVHADELDARAKEPREVRALRKGVPDLEHATSSEAREHPRDLDDALVC